MPGEQIFIDSTASPKLVQKYKQLKKKIKESQDLRNINKINPSLSQNKITLRINLGAVKEQIAGCPSPALSYNSTNLSDNYTKPLDFDSDNSESSLTSYPSDTSNPPTRGRSIERSLLFYKSQQQSRSLSSDSSSSLDSDLSISTLGSLDSISQESTSPYIVRNSLLPSPNSTPLPSNEGLNEMENSESINIAEIVDGSDTPQYEIIEDEIEIDSDPEDLEIYPDSLSDLEESVSPNESETVVEKAEDEKEKTSESNTRDIVKVIKGETKILEKLPPIEKKVINEEKSATEKVNDLIKEDKKIEDDDNMKKEKNRSYMRLSRSRSRSRSPYTRKSHSRSRSRSPYYSRFRSSYKSYNRSRSRSRSRTRSRSRSRSRSRHSRYRDDDYHHRMNRYDRDRYYHGRRNHYYNNRRQRHFEEEDDDDDEVIPTTNTIEKTIMEDPRKKPLLDIEQTQIYRESASYLETEFYKKTIYLGDLEENTPESVIRQIFSGFGEIREIKLFPGKQYAFISYKSAISALEAIKKMNGYKLGSSTIKVGKAKIPERNKYGFGNRPWQDDDGAMAMTQDTYGFEYINNNPNQSSAMANFSAYNIYGHRNVNIINPKTYPNSNIGVLDPRATTRSLLSYDDF